MGEPAEFLELELYDYGTDPLETRNLAAKHRTQPTEMKALERMPRNGAGGNTAKQQQRKKAKS